jgi:hypothetical protein
MLRRSFGPATGPYRLKSQSLADKSFALLQSNARHPSLQLKRVGEYSSVRVGLHYRALGIDVKDGISRF